MFHSVWEICTSLGGHVGSVRTEMGKMKLDKLSTRSLPDAIEKVKTTVDAKSKAIFLGLPTTILVQIQMKNDGAFRGCREPFIVV